MGTVEYIFEFIYSYFHRIANRRLPENDRNIPRINCATLYRFY